MKSDDLISHQKIDEIFKTVRTGIRTLGGCVAAYFAYLSIDSLAGQNTNLILSLLADFKFSATMTLAGTAAAWAILERRLRHKKVEYMQDRIKKLEQRMIPIAQVRDWSRPAKHTLEI
jgi:hypothetical protein